MLETTKLACIVFKNTLISMVLSESFRAFNARFPTNSDVDKTTIRFEIIRIFNIAFFLVLLKIDC
jgi:hypothetical protein